MHINEVMELPEVTAVLDIKDSSHDPYLSGVGNLMDFFQDLSFHEGRAVEVGKMTRTDTQSIIFRTELKKMIRIMGGKGIHVNTLGCEGKIDGTEITDEDIKKNNLRWRRTTGKPGLRGVGTSVEDERKKREREREKEDRKKVDEEAAAEDAKAKRDEELERVNREYQEKWSDELYQGGSIKLKKRKKKQKKKKKKTRKSLHLK